MLACNDGRDSHYPQDHHQITTFSIMCEFGSKKFLLDWNVALKINYWTRIWPSKILTGKEFDSDWTSYTS